MFLRKGCDGYLTCDALVPAGVNPLYLSIQEHETGFSMLMFEYYCSHADSARDDKLGHLSMFLMRAQRSTCAKTCVWLQVRSSVG